MLNLNLPTLASSIVKSGATTMATTSTQQCYVHPVVLFSVLDHYLRRNDNQERVIGTLLGVRSEDGRVVEIRSCFAVPHFETEDQVEVDMEHHRSMFALHKKASAREQIVGWYATGSKLSKYAALIQDFYSREAAPFSAVHLVMDTELTDGQLSIKCLQGSPIGAGAHPENCMFLPLPYELQYPDAELTALQAAADSKDSEEGYAVLISDMEQLENSIEELKAMLQRVTAYVQGVCKGEEKPNNVIGKYLMDMLAVVPKIDSKQFSTLFQTHLQDILMVAYLTNLTRAQLNIADQLQRIV
ncbi:hypothetical protein GGH91_002051 [Coemansia sp. RSA 2671]|uniref:Eukaryotic translation initiation factor 3 subunit F n=2 Tax=Coemansia TaxID=4863 RepID=A0A9W8GPS6_9FUNG|nr:hypothetical protein LPJ60_004314 [Coemansia sp. RSA 2675]KAJ2027297.1 hypothetical protein IWW57_002668 [Coemansia sp. S610]KAJ2346874.1 hypothetical protein GGH91_002051 [Coemansia sp. RSA 2671]KAJ2689264.1 hypothetical protein IWW39_001611 [Coemansia spiralis]KAJ2792840.1 hypothetical protein GGI18_000084 [Coemansia linderi]